MKKDGNKREFFIGQQAEIVRTIEQKDLDRFVEVSGDDNPLHIQAKLSADGAVPSERLFSGKTCHGLLIASYISAALGTKLPGPGTVYLGQTLSFRKPVYVGDTVTVKVQIRSIYEGKGIIKLGTVVVNQNGDCVIDGEATVKVLSFSGMDDTANAAETKENTVMTDSEEEKMIDIRLLTAQDLLSNREKLTHFMYMVRSENSDYPIAREECERYYEDMKRFLDDGSAILIGAFDGEELIGFHWGYVIDYPFGKRMHSYFNAIEPEYRRKGIGSRFWNMLEEETRKRNIDTIEAMCTYANKAAVNYHLHRGFEIERLKVVKKLKNEQEIGGVHQLRRGERAWSGLDRDFPDCPTPLRGKQTAARRVA